MSFELKNIRAFQIPVKSLKDVEVVEKLLSSIGEKTYQGIILHNCKAVKERLKSSDKYCIGYLSGGDWWIEDLDETGLCVSIEELERATQHSNLVYLVVYTRAVGSYTVPEGMYTSYDKAVVAADNVHTSLSVQILEGHLNEPITLFKDTGYQQKPA